MRPFRFGFQINSSMGTDVRSVARRAEAAGFDVITTWDHVVSGEHGWSALAPLVAMAGATERLRVGTLVINNDFHHPVHLAREAATIDCLTGGRLELGIGAGHSFTEYAAIGQRFDPPAVRKARLRDSVEILRKLLAGETVSWDSEFYQLTEVATKAACQEHIPIMVGVNGKTALAHAARHADIVGPTMLGRTLEDGHRHAVTWGSDRIDRAVTHIHANASDRFTRRS